MDKKLALAFALSFGLFGATSASAADLEGAQLDSTGTATPSIYSTSLATTASSPGGTTSGWEVSLTPYLWMSGMKLDVETPQGESIEVDDSFLDILGDLKFTFMGAMELKHGRFVSVQDVILLSMGSSADGHIGPIPIEAEVDERLFSTTHLVGYRVVDEGPMFVDLFAGARFTSIKVEVDLDLPLQTVERDSKKSQIGPVIASRVRFPLNDRWGVAVYGDLGGFGIGADLSWQLLGTIQYEISDRWRLAAGWRHFNARQDKNDFDIEISLDGPILGVSYRF